MFEIMNDIVNDFATNDNDNNKNNTQPTSFSQHQPATFKIGRSARASATVWSAQIKNAKHRLVRTAPNIVWCVAVDNSQYRMIRTANI